MIYLNLIKRTDTISVLSYSKEPTGIHSWEISDPSLRGKILLKLIPKIKKFYLCGTLETKALYSIEADVLISVIDEVFGIKPFVPVQKPEFQFPWDDFNKCVMGFSKMIWTLCWVSLKLFGFMILAFGIFLKFKK